MAKKNLRTLGRQESPTPVKRVSRVLITSGCSFSETLVEETWPIHLQRMLVDETNFSAQNLMSLGLGSQGNGLISRKIIHGVHEQLKVRKPEDILACIMWSGPTRHEQYSSDRDVILRLKHGSNSDQWMINPTRVVEKDVDGGWIMYNNGWPISQGQNYYRHIYDHIYSQIQTLEHIIRTQHYLKLHNIKYAMGVFTGEVLKLDQTLMTEHPSLVHLYEQIDFDHFFDTEGELEFAQASDLPNMEGDHHPSSDQHRLFCQEVIIPHLKSKINI